MKRLILSFVAIAGIAFLYSFWMREATETKPVQVSAGNGVQVSVPASVAAFEVPKTPNVAAQGSSIKSMTEDRKRLFDSSDLMKTLTEIRKGGSQDEKDWGVYILATCTNVQATNRVDAIGSDVSSAPSNLILTSKEKGLESERRQAFESLKVRCSGIFNLTPEQRSTLKSDLIAGSSNNPSVLGRLHALATSPEDRWNTEQVGLITNSIYSSDPILQREAYFALHGAIDRDAPGGADRSDALEMAFPSAVVSGSLSDLESMAACYVIKMCLSNAEQRDDVAKPSGAVERLLTEYKAALANHSDATSLLAIR